MSGLTKAEAAEAKKDGEGWGVVRPGDRRAHYYRSGLSLCRRVRFYAGPLDADEGSDGPDDCRACRKKLRA